MNRRNLKQSEVLQSILQSQVERYPQMELEDLYKLVFQAAMGSEHAVQNRSAVAGYLQLELNSMGDGPDEPIIDPISPDGEIVRVHLRPYVRAGGDPSKLLEAFIDTSRRHHGSKNDLERWWGQAVQWLGEGWPLLAPQQARSFFLKMEAQGFPAVHHSPNFIEAYKPAYRVVLQGLIEHDVRGLETAEQ
jgi:hypothetical protein